MLELIQWLVLSVLAGAVGWMFRQNRMNRPPAWLRDLDSEEMVTQRDLDQYHLRVIQMSQAQRELMQAKFEEIERSRPISPVAHLAPEPLHSAPVESIPPAETAPIPTGGFPPAQPCLQAEDEGLSSEHEEMASATPPAPVIDGGDPSGRAIALFREGKSIDQIAQELRIGRQEAQLLIRMAHHKSPFLAGV
jgi:hypothetical protein